MMNRILSRFYARMAERLMHGDEIDNPFYTISTDVKNQHYVWRNYLSPWVVKQKIWCKRGSSIFNQKPEKLAKQEYFYEIEDLSQGELGIVKGALDKIDPDRKTYLPQVIGMYLRAAKGTDFVRKNAIESYHCRIERNAGPILDKIKDGDLTLLQNEITRAEFSHFIGMQYCRTKKMFDRISEGTSKQQEHHGNPGDVIPSRLAKILTILTAESIAYWIHSGSSTQILTATEDKPFITSDQPVYNIYSTNDFSEVKNLSLFYPISPTKAILMWPKNKQMPNLDTATYNNMTRKHAHQFVFAKAKSDLIE